MNNIQQIKEVITILNKVASTGSTKEKEQILRENKDNELLQQIIFYTYNPYLKYKMTSATIKPTPSEASYNVHSIFSTLDVLANSNINNNLRDSVNSFLGSIEDEEVKDLYIKMILKDLKIKCNTKTFNKVWDSLIPSFNVMLAEKYWDYVDRVNGKDITITMKMDGNRMVCIKEHGKVKMFTRQGKEYEGLVEIEEVLNNCPYDNFVLDGEILCLDYKTINPKDTYKTTSKLCRPKGEKRGLTFVVFDFIELDNFKKGACKTLYSKRRTMLENFVAILNTPFLNIVEKLYEGIGNEETILKLLDKVTSQGQEGLMINFNDEPYKLTRTTNILKVKKMQSVDLRIIGFEEGEGRLKGTLGNLLVDYKGNKVGVGSGYEDKERDYIWSNREKLLGRVVEIKYFEETTNQNNDLLSLRFPVFKCIREEGKEVSYH